MNPSEACNALIAYLEGEGRNDVLSVGGFLPSTDPSFHASQDGRARYVYSAMPMLSAEFRWPATARIRTGDADIHLSAVSVRIGHTSVAFSSPGDGGVVHEFQLAAIQAFEMRRASDLEGRKSQLGRILDLFGGEETI